MRRAFRTTERSRYVCEQLAKCKVCSEERTFFRAEGDRQRGRSGHLKHIFCYWCKRTTAHVQMREVA